MTGSARACRPNFRLGLRLLAAIAIIVTALTPVSSADIGIRLASVGRALMGGSVYTYDSPAQQSPAQAVGGTVSERVPAARASAEARALALPTTPRFAAETGATGWKVGQPIENLTRAGNSPSWSTVRARYWKNTANDALEGEYSASNLARMEGGKPPLHDELGVPMELNHIIPRWQGGGHTLENLEPLWPWEHAAVDPFRFYTGPTP